MTGGEDLNYKEVLSDMCSDGNFFADGWGRNVDVASMDKEALEYRSSLELFKCQIWRRKEEELVKNDDFDDANDDVLELATMNKKKNLRKTENAKELKVEQGKDSF